MLQAAEPDDAPFLHLARSGDGWDPRGQPVFERSAMAGGERLEAGWRAVEGGLEAWTCRYGLFPLYYAASRDEAWISVSLPRLLSLGVPPALDDAAVAAFLRLGFFLGQDTAIRAIRVLPPGGRLSWRRGRLVVAGERPATHAANLSGGEALDTYARLFEAAIAACPEEERTFVPLTGGRDSRHILLALAARRQGDMRTFTVQRHPPAAGDDVEVAREVARALGLPHAVIAPPPSPVRAELRKNELTGLCADEHGWALPIRARLPEGAVVYDGLGGDVLSAGLFLEERGLALAQQGDAAAWADHVLSGWDRCGEAGYRTLLSPEAHARFSREAALRRLAAEMEEHLDAPNPVQSFFFWNRTRRETALCPFALYPPSTRLRLPYLDPPLYAFLAGLPPRTYLDHGFHSAAIRRAYPRHATLPYATAPGAEAGGRLRRFALEAALHLARAPSGVTRRAALVPRLLRVAATGEARALRWLQVERLLPILQLERFQPRPAASGARPSPAVPPDAVTASAHAVPKSGG